jgi:hypothetical protein
MGDSMRVRPSGGGSAGGGPTLPCLATFYAAGASGSTAMPLTYFDETHSDPSWGHSAAGLVVPADGVYSFSVWNSAIQRSADGYPTIAVMGMSGMPGYSPLGACNIWAPASMTQQSVNWCTSDIVWCLADDVITVTGSPNSAGTADLAAEVHIWRLGPIP